MEGIECKENSFEESQSVSLWGFPDLCVCLNLRVEKPAKAYVNLLENPFA